MRARSVSDVCWRVYCVDVNAAVSVRLSVHIYMHTSALVMGTLLSVPVVWVGSCHKCVGSDALHVWRMGW